MMRAWWRRFEKSALKYDVHARKYGQDERTVPLTVGELADLQIQAKSVFEAYESLFHLISHLDTTVTDLAARHGVEPIRDVAEEGEVH